MSPESGDRVAFFILCGCASLAASGGSATRTPCAFASLGSWVGLGSQFGSWVGLAVGSAVGEIGRAHV